jgi:integration host factor subunit alpha
MLCDAVQREVGLSAAECKALVSQVLEEIASTLARGEPVKLSSFGSFVVQQKKERVGRNLSTGESVPISARRILKFKQSPLSTKKMNSLLHTDLDHG